MAARFFVSTPLGYESVTADEIKKTWSFLLDKNSQPTLEKLPELTLCEGGIELETSLFLGLQLNFFLKTANRVLLRVAEFKARDLPKYYQKMLSLPWQEYLKSAQVEWKISAQGSRLNNEKRLQESGQDALEKKLPQKTEGVSGAIYVRMHEDLCTVSIDTSGEHLHKRGWMALRGEAPLRETWAAILLKALIEDADVSQSSLLDPMAGSGSFLLEARALDFPNFNREYAFQKWVNCPKLFLSKSLAFNYKNISASKGFQKFYAGDIEPRMEEVLKKNWQMLTTHMQAWQKGLYQERPLEVRVGDSLQPGVGFKCDYLILNPPYGERLPGVEQGTEQMLQSLVKNYSPQKLGILLPEIQKVRVPRGYKLLKALRVNNGGIRCLFTILTAV